MEAHARPSFSEGKDDQARLERERVSVPQQPPPPAVMSVPMYSTPGMVTTIQPVLPPQLWPHNFLVLSVILAAVLGFMNPFTLIATIPAAILGIVGYSQSENGEYSAAKTSSKISLMLLVVSVTIFAVFWLGGWVPTALLLPYIYYTPYYD